MTDQTPENEKDMKWPSRHQLNSLVDDHSPRGESCEEGGGTRTCQKIPSGSGEPVRVRVRVRIRDLFLPPTYRFR